MKKEPPYSKELIQYRMERARETLDTAQLLRDQNADTASIVNRAYYAMFYAALAILAAVGEETSKHSGVLALFDRHFVKTGVLPKEMGKFLHCTPPSTRVKRGTTKTNLKSHAQWRNGWWNSPFSLSTLSRKSFEINCDC
ncbi:MAG: hypothetical protein HFACDABA_00153 [Anaerolineales bacterium]|nr:hypothetical protein [Anaerolineales bacterium]